MRRLAAQRHGQSEPLLADSDKSSFSKVNEISEGAADIVFDPIVSSVNTFAGPGNFGRMFPTATPFRPSDAALRDLANSMIEADGDADTSADHPNLPAGFTYLGQFIDHDITFDKTQGIPPAEVPDPVAIEQGRTPNLDLDSLYGFGPGNPLDGIMYAGSPGSEVFVIGETAFGGIGNVAAGFRNDLRRVEDGDEKGRAIIPDGRNDENLIVAQTHLALLKFHNKLIATLPPSQPGELSLFERAKELVTWHYQWIVANDFLSRLTKGSVLKDVRDNGRKFYKFETVGDGRPFMPIEFSVAAYRLGHSMIRSVYNYNRVFNLTSPIPGSLGNMFRFSFGKGGIVPIPSDWIIDWRRFFEVGSFAGQINHTRKIDALMADPLKDLITHGRLPDPPPNLAERNLLRGSRLGLPSGQELAAVMGIDPLTAAELSTGASAAVVTANGFDTQTPLWFYILKEAEAREGGLTLGELGSRIVAEVFLGLLEGDPNSFKKQQPEWTPTLPCANGNDFSANGNDFTMADLLLFVDELNPIGD